MSAYGLIKASSRAKRSDTITDLHRINSWRVKNGKAPVCSTGQSVRRLENCVALGLDGLDLSGLPKLERGSEFYLGILPEIKESERQLFQKMNSHK